MSSIAQKKNAFKVQIRKKRVQDKIAHLRATYSQKNAQLHQGAMSDLNISELIDQSLLNKQKLIQNIGLIKSASFNINQKNAHLFFPLVKDFCFIVGNLQEMKQTSLIKDKHMLYNQIITALINISSNQVYQWPVGQYLLIIKNLIVRERQINTMWLLSNILYQKPNQNSDTAKQLTFQLLKYDSISFCEQRFQKKFQNQQDMLVFACYSCSFLSNSVFLKLEQHKRILSIIEDLSSLNLDSIDWFILESMIDHAPYLAASNYELIYSDLISKFRESYIKKKKTRMVLKYLEFVKTYLFCQIQQSININQTQDGQQIDNKVAKANYQRFSVNTLPILNICFQNRSPQIKAYLMQICSMILEYYFPFVDLQNQQLYLNLAQGLKQDAKSVLSKYSNRALQWQLRFTYILLKKIKQYKISNENITEFIHQSSILDALGILLKDKIQNVGIIGQITDFLLLLFDQLQIIVMAKDRNEANQIYLDNIKQTYELILDNHMVNDQDLYKKIQSLVNLCDMKTE